MIQKGHLKVLEMWFEGLNNGDLSGVIALFAREPTIKNAANPRLTGPNAPKQLLEDFFARTESRNFKVRGVAEGDGSLFAYWEALLTFGAGIQIADVTTNRTFNVTLVGVDRFTLKDGKIESLDIFHETTSVIRAARDNAGP